jgi:hypothetical protein
MWDRRGAERVCWQNPIKINHMEDLVVDKRIKMSLQEVGW